MADYQQVFIQQYELPNGIYYRVLVGKISGEEEARRFGEGRGCDGTRSVPATWGASLFARDADLERGAMSPRPSLFLLIC